MTGKFSKTGMNTKSPICPWFCKPYESKKERMVFWSLVFISEGLRTFGLEKKKKKKPLTPDAGILRPAAFGHWKTNPTRETKRLLESLTSHSPDKLKSLIFLLRFFWELNICKLAFGHYMFTVNKAHTLMWTDLRPWPFHKENSKSPRIL